MKLTVDIYKLDQKANDVKAGTLTLEKGKITPSSDRLLLKNMATTPITVYSMDVGHDFDPKKEPEQFMRALHLAYFSPYLRAMKTVEVQ